MRKKRLIYTLLFNESYFMLSRNFRLQKVGDLQWVEDKYNFKKIAFAIDELIILNVGRNARNSQEFGQAVTQVIRDFFVPVAVGGGIRCIEDARSLFMSGADKIIINTILEQNPELVRSLVREFGSQAIIASIDFQVENGVIMCYNSNGSNKIDFSFSDYLTNIQELGVGELYLNSMRKDGTGQGYDIQVISPFLNQIKIPLIMAGGAGFAKHFIEAAAHDSIDAVATANLFNFLGNSLPFARDEMLREKIPLAKFAPVFDISNKKY